MLSFTKSDWFKRFTQILTILIAVIYLANVFLKMDSLDTVIAGLLILLYIDGFLIMNKINRIVSGVLLLLGIFFLWYYRVPFDGWEAAVLKNIGTIVLIAFAPILASPFFYKPYQAELKNVCNKYISSPTMFLLLAGFVSYFLGFYMSMAALPIVYSLLVDVAKDYKCHKQFVAAICAGNGLIIAAAPSTGAGIVIPAIGIEYVDMLIFGGIITIVLIIATAFIYGNDAKKQGAVNVEKKAETEVKWSNIGMLVFLFVLLCFVIIMMDTYTPISVLACVSLLALPFAIIFALIQKKMDVFKKRMVNYANKNMLSNPNVMTIVGISGFAGEGLKRAEFIQKIFELFAQNPQLYLLFPLLIMLVALITSFIGVHPTAMGTTLSSILTPETLHTSPIGLAMIILVGWSLSLASSPFSAVCNLAASSSGLDIWSFTAKKAFKWAFICIIIATIMIDAITVLGF